MSKILCVIDGMTDPEFQAGDYPSLASMNHIWDVDTCRGSEPESLGCILRLLGVNTVPDHLRGYAEALGAGIPVDEHDLVLRGSWFALDEDGVCTVPVPGPVSLPEPHCCRYYHLEQYKSLLVFPEIAERIGEIQTYPPYHCVGKHAVQLCPKGSDALRAVFENCLGSDRCLIPWGQSVPAQLPSFPQPGAVICGTTIVKGIARLLGMTLMDVPGATGDIDTDLASKAAAALDAARRYPFVLLHINGADEAAHRRNAKEKKAFLQRVDKAVLAALLESEHELIVTSDHGTDPTTGQHTGSKQPVFALRATEKCTQLI